MGPERFRRWLEQIYTTEERELSCSQCFDATSLYVEALLDGDMQSEPLRLVKQHLEQCRACNEEFETLYEIARLERADGVQSGDG